MFGTLAWAETWINRAAYYGKVWAGTVIGGSAYLGYSVFAAHPWLSLLFAATALIGLKTWTGSAAFADDAQVLKISLRNRMREGQPVSDAANLPGATALHKRYWFLKGDNVAPIATFSSCLRGLLESGLPSWKAFGTTVLSLVGFGRMTQQGLTSEEKRSAGLGRFDIYLPNLHQAQSYSSTRIYAPTDNTKGLAPGDVDMEEFERMFRLYAPGRDYLTAYDFARMGEGNRLRDIRDGRGNWLSRLMGRLAGNRRVDQLMLLFADRVVEEDRKLVPAISKSMLLRFYRGSAQYDLMREHREGDLDPSPVRMPSNLQEATLLQPVELESLYRSGEKGDTPTGESNGKAIILPDTFVGKVISSIANSIWKGKVIDPTGTKLVNKILGTKLVHADVFTGPSWLDGKPSTIIDYKRTSWLAFFIRDEIRQLHQGFYLGKCYVRLPFGLRFNCLYFVLDFRKQSD